MRHIILFQIILSVIIGLQGCKMVSNSSTSESSLYLVEGNITVTSDYCGGARPTEDMINKLKTPKPYPGKKLYVRASTQNDFSKPVLYAITTDAEGKFSIQLPAGEYCIIDEFRISQGYTDSLLTNKIKYLATTDADCIKEWSNSCLMQFKVESKELNNLQLNIHQQCFRPEGIPCLTYTGELPK